MENNLNCENASRPVPRPRGDEDHGKRKQLVRIASDWISLWCPPVDWELFHRLHSGNFQDCSPAERASSKEGFARGLEEFVRAFPDLRTTIDELVVDEAESKVAILWRAEGTNRTEFMGIGPTGKLTVITGIEIIELFDERIIRRWGEWDISDHNVNT